MPVSGILCDGLQHLLSVQWLPTLPDPLQGFTPCVEELGEAQTSTTDMQWLAAGYVVLIELQPDQMRHLA